MKKLFFAVIICCVTLSLAHADSRFLNMHTAAEPESIDPNTATGNIEDMYISALFEGLTTYDPKNLSPQPGVAEKWVMSSDGKMLTFTLRKDAKWSDGTPVTAQDFVYSYERLLNPKTGSKFASMLYPLKNAEPYNLGKITDPKLLGVKAKDPQTLILEFAAPTPYAPYLTSHYTYFPVPRQSIDKHGGSWTRVENFVSNGPFTMKEWTPHKNMTVVKNPNYWNQATVKLDGIRFWPIDDLETALKMYDDGQLDVAFYLPPSKTPILRTRPDYRKSPWLTSEYYWVNTTNPQLKDPRVRRALAMAIDRDVLTEKFLHGLDLPLTTFTAKGLPGYTSPTNGPKFNPEAARKLLVDAGIKDPSTLQLEILYNTNDMRKTVAQVIQQMWKQNLGITVQLHNEEWKSYIKDMQNKNFGTLCRAGWVGDYPDPMTFLDMATTTSTANFSRWGNAKYDELINKARLEPNAQKRMQYLTQAETILLDEMPLIPIYQQNRDYLVKPYVKGYHANLIDHRVWQSVSLDDTSTGKSMWETMKAWH